MRLDSDRETQLRKLHSLTGVVPLGVFLLLHLSINARAMQGRVAFDRMVERLVSIPLLPLIELVLVALPLAFHAGYGLYLVYVLRGASEPGKVSPYTKNWVVLERATGIAALIFIGFHLYDLRGPVLSGYLVETDVYPKLAAQLSSTTSWGIPLFALFYLAGVAATVFHFAAGLYAFSVTWGFVQSERAMRVAARACGGLGILLFLIGASTVIYYATGSRFFIAG
jgi:succinate dehydrogenase cytochrome b subunit